MLSVLLLLLYLQTWGDSHILVGVLLGLATLALAEGDTHKAASLLTEAQVRRERERERGGGGGGTEKEGAGGWSL